MKKLLLAVTLITAILLTGCSKDENDEREKFVGTYEATQTVSVPGLEMYENMSGTQEIRLSSDASRIEIGSVGGPYHKARVSGNSYVYDKFSETENIDGVTITIEYTGSGVINGNVINETGTISVYLYGEKFDGTWSCTLAK